MIHSVNNIVPDKYFTISSRRYFYIIVSLEGGAIGVIG